MKNIKMGEAPILFMLTLLISFAMMQCVVNDGGNVMWNSNGPVALLKNVIVSNVWLLTDSTGRRFLGASLIKCC